MADSQPTPPRPPAQTSPPSRDKTSRDDAPDATAHEGGTQEDIAREGVSERGGEGGYGNDTGFATGTEAPRDGDQGGLSEREQEMRDTYRAPHRDTPRDTGQGRTPPDTGAAR